MICQPDEICKRSHTDFLVFFSFLAKKKNNRNDSLNWPDSLENVNFRSIYTGTAKKGSFSHTLFHVPTTVGFIEATF